MACPRCSSDWSEIGPDGGLCKVDGWIARPEIDGGRRNGATPATETGFGASVVTVSNVERTEVHWLWRGRLAVGRLTALLGDPGVGKSYITLAIASAISRGAPLPGEVDANDAGDVLMLTGEDGIGDTIRPRLEDAGADLDRCHVLTGVGDLSGREEFPSLVDHLAEIERVLRERHCKLLIIDPINAFLGSMLDTHRDAALRSVLSPLAALCDRLGVACLFVMHLRKSGADRAIYRASGSIAYTAASRSVLLAGANPENPHERALVWVKGNLTEPMAALGYEISEGRFLWTGESELTAGRILAADGDEDGGALDEAVAFLRDALSDGSAEAQAVQRDATAHGISTRTLRRARERLGVEVSRIGIAGKQGGGRWIWSLGLDGQPPGDEPLDDQPPGLDDHTESLATLTDFVSETANSVGHLNIRPCLDGQPPSLDTLTGKPGGCAVCGDCEIEGYTPAGEPRCKGHFTTHPLVEEAVRLGGKIVKGQSE